MKKDSVIDWTGYITVRLLGPVLRIMPLRLSFFLGRALGGLIFSLNIKHRALAYANIKTAFGGKLSPKELKSLTRNFYRAFGQNLIEVFLIPLINENYIKKYFILQGRQYIAEALKKGKGVIFLGIHEGSWEISNVVCANLGFPLTFFISQQKFPRLNSLLNSYRSQKGCRLLQRRNQTRQLIEVLKNNNAVGMTADQGGRLGVLIDFFGKSASMSSGALRLALKYGATILPGFYARIKGPYMKISLQPHFELIRTGNLQDDIRQNLIKLNRLFEDYLEQYPQEYLWSYKIWKYSRNRKILLLSDGKAGHLRQAQAAAQITASLLLDRGINADMDTIEVNFKNKFCKPALVFSSLLAAKYSCQGCLWCLKKFLTEDSYRALTAKKYDFIISAGSALAPINYIISGENLARSIVVMRPSLLSTKRFSLVIMPWHDRPVRGKNIAVTDGALNLIDDEYLKNKAEDLKNYAKISKDLVLGLLIGGDNRNFRLTTDSIAQVIGEVKKFAEQNDAEILITTSRRTSKDVEALVKSEFTDYERCKLMVIANEKNLPSAVGGILGLSKIIIASPESISMISEAASSNRYVFVFDAPGLGAKHRSFLRHLQKNKSVYLAAASRLNKRLAEIWPGKPQKSSLKDKSIVGEAIRKLL